MGRSTPPIRFQIGVMEHHQHAVLRLLDVDLRLLCTAHDGLLQSGHRVFRLRCRTAPVCHHLDPLFRAAEDGASQFCLTEIGQHAEQAQQGS